MIFMGKTVQWVALMTVLGLLGGCGSPVAATKGSPPAPGAAESTLADPPSATDAPAIREAKSKDNGQDLPVGQSRELATANGIVIVRKSIDGKISYEAK